MEYNNFWADDGNERHQKIARTFYENIGYDHPDFITSDGQGDRLCYHCVYNRTCVKYYNYNGPRVVNIK
jgi:hypothetical protein